MDSSLLAMAAGLGASVQQGRTQRLGPASHCSGWAGADSDMQNYLANNPHDPVVAALDAQPYNPTWQEAFVRSPTYASASLWWGRKKYGHGWYYFYCPVALPQNGDNSAVATPIGPRPPSVPTPQPPIGRSASRRYRFP